MHWTKFTGEVDFVRDFVDYKNSFESNCRSEVEKILTLNSHVAEQNQTARTRPGQIELVTLSDAC